MVLSAAAHIEMVPDAKKQGSVYTITELAFPVVGYEFSCPGCRIRLVIALASASLLVRFPALPLAVG